MRDISERLGLTKAALYYYFPSKETILDALLEPLMSELTRLVDLVRHSPPPSTAVLVEQLAEVMAGSGGVLLAFINDPSIVRRRIGQSDMISLQHALVRALAGPAPTDERLLRAHCAVGALKAGIIGRAWDQAEAEAEAGSGPVGEPQSVNAELLRAFAVRGVQSLQPLVTAAERREIVAAALAALGGDDPTWDRGSGGEPGARCAGTTGLCVESTTSASATSASATSTSASTTSAPPVTPTVTVRGMRAGAVGMGIALNPPGIHPG
ncbi:TetR/AcrR family transcriptional regulator [Frankia sp. AgB32]|uniref:TetR/AcrR family transcriptional regulator n=1 Tax=Frankia sp. AgB32 TaxID=631119 RepID=UPI00200F0CAC|nr:TetR/AcrR family transcriptional regulator [Frankia sp. AgB32]MCK9896789.1 TetR/AcrR family transcriptional regulator [Frankia sp. AgB32]